MCVQACAHTYTRVYTVLKKYLCSEVCEVRRVSFGHSMLYFWDRPGNCSHRHPNAEV